ncbi:MAG: hypothetical protein A2X25_09140 [Chloroflexi bacterium GWB2_49_20]|nr:MAG: hypothetical protein A2X25_09140 [Chloroflexi bacterium GWB2_49_20]OGN79406.1 MAG: hypothetical protein A2X26_04885 [Chloroflexi bacterium GWC2_49_37]OGN82825.1 MAG: hypothetical protein A2X27_07810 [Chloroflexi bacterium GWD2_49_16]HCC79726.1 hypothetical protein [Anaerolineae bacterium]HCM97298.1 hypothetical protein [Anaerolineae bacterium]
MSILDLPVISRIRRNHGLEHASLTLLSNLQPNLALAGISFPGGFFVLGKVDTGDLRSIVFQALIRLQNGERQLVVHPNCGTNYATSGIVAGVLAWLSLSGAKNRREKLDRLPLVISLVTLAFIYTRPLGLLIQERITTSSEPGGLKVMDIFPVRIGNFCLHLVVTND